MPVPERSSVNLKVYAVSAGVSRRIVAAPSKAAAARALGLTNYSANLYMGDTGNADEIAVAMSEPGVVFSRPNAKPLHLAPFERERNAS